MAPNSSLSSSEGAMEPQSTGRKAWLARRLKRWIMRATSSLPVPVSPSMITVASVGADARDGLVNFHHDRRVADHFGLGQFFLFGLGLAAVARGHGALDGVEHHVQVEGLGDVIERAAAGGGHDGLHGAAAGHQDHRAAGVLALGGIQDVEAGALIDIDIGNDDRIGRIGQPLDGLAGGGNGVHGVSIRLEGRLDGELQCRIVFH